MNSEKTGLVLGKFIPLHKGHELLLSFARCFVGKLFVVVDNIVDAPIPGALRCQWIQELLPKAEVFYLPSPNPQHPEEHPDFWEIWKSSLLNLLPQKPDYVFASEHYGHALAHVLDAAFVPFDLERHIIPTSGTEIRKDPFSHWDHLSSFAKRYYLKRVCIFGPESSGKTTLCQALATHYHTTWVPEYARLLIESQNKIQESDMLMIAQGQVALEHTVIPLANKILFCDTDPLLTTLWSQWLYGRCSEQIYNVAMQQSYDLYLLTKPDLVWEADSVRYLPGQSEAFYHQCIELLTKMNKRFALVSGVGPERMDSAISHVQGLF
jgi:NadR type nicotinamide-nucleotide adenylyltransferase